MLYNKKAVYYDSRANEKDVVTPALEKELASANINSLLDIHSGSGRISIALASAVPKYVAVHPYPVHAAYLRSYGKEVIEDEFPTKVPGAPFDAALAYHSLSLSDEKQEAFINEALEAVKPGGSFLLVTYRWHKDHWSKLLSKLDKDEVKNQEDNLHSILFRLHKEGRVAIHEIRTAVHTVTAAEMFKALSFVYSDGNPKKVKYFLHHKNEIIDILNRYHRSPTGFSFSFQHIIAHTKKKQN
jgi:SAM-dependent methyltransferase